MNNNISKENFTVDIKTRNRMNNHNSFFILFTGFSGSGKTTLANAFELFLNKKDIRTYCLDGDNVRHGLNKDLGFSAKDRSENLRRIGEVSKLFVDAGIITLASFVAPYKKDRESIKEIIGEDQYIEVYISTSIEECERRDVKGLYSKARKGLITGFTGIDAPYEIPENPDVIFDTKNQCVDELASQLYEKLQQKISENII